MKKLKVLILVFVAFACAEKQPEGIIVTIKNTLDFDRSFETVEIKKTQLASLKTNNFKVLETETNAEIVSQAVDYDKDGINDVLLFQPEISANSEKTFKIIGINTEKKQDSSVLKCYSRFVPERTDDYAWENNRVAFRTYGPKAQKMQEEGIKGGTLSSGIDAWLKRVEYPIINKWYKKNTDGTGSYHEDTGEGLDNFHVGVSRGIGGIAVHADSVYMVSKNFVSFKNITNGPIRTAFILNYAPYKINGIDVKETKYISLDYGQNLSRYTINISGTDHISAGITLHNKDGETTTNKENRFMSYWEPYFDSELGQGIVVQNKNVLLSFDEYITEEKDKSNLYAQLKVSDNLVDYYAGFGWKKAGQFTNKEAWNNYLSRFSKCLDTPLKIKFINSAK